jgi:DNA-binding winged helix-turn-helix (wHTH) protein
MKKLLTSLFVPQRSFIDESLVDAETFYIFRVKLLQAILLTAFVVGSATGVLELLNILPKDMFYTPLILSYGVLNLMVYFLLIHNPYKTYIFSMNFCIFSTLVTLSVMSASLVYDEFRFIWFFLLSFASFTLGGKWYGITITLLILSIIWAQFFTMNLQLSNFAIFTFSASLLTFNAFFLFFLNKIEKDAHILQQHISQEIKRREAKEQTLQKMQEVNITHFKDDYLWDSRQKVLTHQGKNIALAQKEQLLLSLLVENKNCCVSFEDIQAHVWVGNYEDEISIQSVKLQITGLRKKLPKGCINNVYGCGYIFHT